MVGDIERSYLEHILIALRVRDRAAPYRDFLDNWYAFRVQEGHLTSGGRPIWFNNPDAIARGAALRRMHFVSAQANAVLARATDYPHEYRQLRYQKDRACRLMVDHAVPLGVIVRLLQEDCNARPTLTIDQIEKRLTSLYHLGVITADEDAHLNSLGLRSNMPANWNGADVEARYRAAGIAAATGETR